MFASRSHARVMLAIAVAMCVLALAAILTAHLLMPNNAGGRRGLAAFYLGFGPWLPAWGSVALSASSAVRKPVATPRPSTHPEP